VSDMRLTKPKRELSEGKLYKGPGLEMESFEGHVAG